MELSLRPGVVSRLRLRGDEEGVRAPLEPGRDPQLRRTVGRGRVDVIHAVLEEQLQRSLRVGVGDMAQPRRTEDRARALMAGLAERRLRDQAASLAQ